MTPVVLPPTRELKVRPWLGSHNDRAARAESPPPLPGEDESPPDDAFGELWEGAMHTIYQISAIIESKGWLEVECSIYALVEVFCRLAVPSMDTVALTRQPCSNIILRRERVAS